MRKQLFTWSGLLIGLGSILILVAIVIYGIFGVLQKRGAEQAEKTIETMKNILPDTYEATLDDRINTIMSAMEIDGISYCGVLEIPAFSIKLPIGEVWEKNDVLNYPCRYTGTIYDNSLVIGGSDTSGQLDCMKTISNGDTVMVTDMTGARYTYIVTEVNKSSDVSTEYLTSGAGDLVLFAKNTYSYDYTVVRCKLH